jgi:hypothetical protein
MIPLLSRTLAEEAMTCRGDVGWPVALALSGGAVQIDTC